LNGIEAGAVYQVFVEGDVVFGFVVYFAVAGDSVGRVFVFQVELFGGQGALGGVVLAGDGIANAEARGVFHRQPGVDEAAKLDHPKQDEEQYRQGQGKFNEGLAKRVRTEAADKAGH